MKKIITLLIVSLISHVAFAEFKKLNDDARKQRNDIFKKDIEEIMQRLSSGDIVGNGGGLAEQNYLFAYTNLGDYIVSCLELDYCDSDNQLWFDILNIVDENKNKKNNLVFISPKDFPNFFFDKHDNQERSAKTGFSKDFPIFINLDHIYGEGNNKEITSAIGLLVHEVGHQAGIASHTQLDRLGLELRKFISLNDNTINLNLHNKNFSLSAYNLDIYSKYNSLLFVYDNKLIDLSRNVNWALSCPKNKTVHSFEITNLHWERPLTNDSNRTISISSNAWVDYLCEDNNGTLWPEKKDLNIEVLIDYHLERNNYLLLDIHSINIKGFSKLLHP